MKFEGYWLYAILRYILLRKPWICPILISLDMSILASLFLFISMILCKGVTLLN